MGLELQRSSYRTTAESGLDVDDSCSPTRQSRFTFSHLASVQEEVTSGTFGSQGKVSDLNAYYSCDADFSQVDEAADTDQDVGYCHEQSLEANDGWILSIDLIPNSDDPLSKRNFGGKKPKLSKDSGPSLMELSGYNPKRQEFDPEYDNDAEQLLAEMEFKETDTEGGAGAEAQGHPYLFKEVSSFHWWTKGMGGIS
ncbi:hypothetical protein U1Q18_047048 [Sarracenia purpurea var. burkii]